ncbi:hypothetical protein ILYODFUR_028997 [Ilyodon furcidens]|uniref:Uncharacterized protein n=1 Tax=Ilyodon furcidens TaxID=33524 RepID=A0ABV0VIR2_9TELE
MTDRLQSSQIETTWILPRLDRRLALLKHIFGVPLLHRSHVIIVLLDYLLAAAKCFLPHTDSTEPVHPPPLSSVQATTHYCTLLVWKPSYSPHCVLFLVSLNPSPPGGELTQPTYPSMYQSAQYS